MLVQVLAALLQYNSLLVLLGKQWKIAKSLGASIHVEDLEEAFGFWLWNGPAPAGAAIWGLNQDGSPVCVCSL